MTTTFRIRTTQAVLIMMTVANITPANDAGDTNDEVPQAVHGPAVQLGLPQGPPPPPIPSPPIVTVDGEDWQRELTMWAVGRFQEAGLAIPSVHVSFHASIVECGGYAGKASTGGNPANVHICRQGARKVLLHELTHVWAHQLPDSLKQSVVELIGATSWNTDGEWHQHGSEHAAEIITWALLEGNIPPYTSSFPEFASVNHEEVFRLLTGRPIPDWDGDITTSWDAP